MRRIVGIVTRIWVTCGRCGGNEEVWDPEIEDWVTCPACNGKGEVSR